MYKLLLQWPVSDCKYPSVKIALFWERTVEGTSGWPNMSFEHKEGADDKIRKCLHVRGDTWSSLNLNQCQISLSMYWQFLATRNSPRWETDSRSATQEILRLLWKFINVHVAYRHWTLDACSPRPWVAFSLDPFYMVLKRLLPLRRRIWLAERLSDSQERLSAIRNSNRMKPAYRKCGVSHNPVLFLDAVFLALWPAKSPLPPRDNFVCGLLFSRHTGQLIVTPRRRPHPLPVITTRQRVLPITRVVFYILFFPLPFYFLFFRAANSWLTVIYQHQAFVTLLRAINAWWCWCCFLAATSANHCAFSTRDPAVNNTPCTQRGSHFPQRKKNSQCISPPSNICPYIRPQVFDTKLTELISIKFGIDGGAWNWALTSIYWWV
jgi:hypothetical protein